MAARDDDRGAAPESDARPRGKYLFEWLGRNAKGPARRARRSPRVPHAGRSNPEGASLRGGGAGSPPCRAIPAVLSDAEVPGRTRDIEDARKERASARETELLMLRARLESKDECRRWRSRRVRPSRSRPRRAERSGRRGVHRSEGGRGHRSEGDRAAREVSDQGEEDDEVEIPKWLRALGLDEDTLSVAKPFLKNQLAICRRSWRSSACNRACRGSRCPRRTRPARK